MAAQQQIRFVIPATEYTRLVKVHDAAHPFDQKAVPIAWTARGLMRSGLILHEEQIAKACRIQRRRDKRKNES